jgi:hypothetical protein
MGKGFTVFGAGSQVLGLLARGGYLGARHDLDEWTDLLVCTKIIL